MRGGLPGSGALEAAERPGKGGGARTLPLKSQLRGEERGEGLLVGWVRVRRG